MVVVKYYSINNMMSDKSVESQGKLYDCKNNVRLLVCIVNV